MDTAVKRQKRMRRHRRVRAKIKGSASVPRLTVFRSGRHIAAQLIDDDVGRTVAAASDREAGEGSKKKTGGKNAAAAALVGSLIAKRALEKKINRAVFDRGHYRYHGAVKAVADAAQRSGLNI